MFQTILKTLVPIPKIDQAKRALFIGPHPDDIEIGAGALVAKLIQKGCKVEFLIVTDGGAGYVSEGDTIENLVTRRKEEALKAANFLHVQRVHLLGYHDGEPYQVWDVAKDIAKVMIECNPDIVFTPDPALPSETHPDHISCGQATNIALILASNRLIAKRNRIEVKEEQIANLTPRSLAYYYTHRANSYVKVSKEHVQQMFTAILYHQTQFPSGKDGHSVVYESIQKYLTLRLRRFGWKTKGRYAMGFFVMDQVHQHCFSEINEW